MSLKNLIKQGQVEFKLRLNLFSSDGPGILELILANGSTVSVCLTGRHVKVLLIYNKALLV